MSSIANFFRTHALVAFFAILIGSLTVLPSILAPLALGSDYQGVQFLYLDDEDIYRARIHEILDGYYAVSSPYVYEYKDAPMVVPPINEYPYAILALVFGLSAVMVGSKFFLPAALFLLAYALTRKLLGPGDDDIKKWFAIASGVFVVFGVDLVNYRSSFELLLGLSERTQLIVWTRPVNPIIGGLMVFGFLITLWAVVLRTHRFAWVAGGLLLASMVGYFFSFGISASIFAAMFLLFLVTKHYQVAKELAYVFLLALIIDAPYWFNTLTMVGGEEGRAIAERNGMFFTHAPVFNKFLIAATVFFAGSLLYAYAVKKDKAYLREHSRVWLFLTGLLLGCIIAFNQQIVTGRAIWFHHFVQYAIPIAFVVSTVTLFFIWRRYFKHTTILVIGIGMALSLWLGVASAASYVHKMDEFRALQRYAPLFSFLEQAPKDCVVLLKEYDEEIERLIAAYTDCNVYSTTSGFIGITKERILHNYLLRLRLNEITPDTAREYMEEHSGEVRGYFFENWNQQFGLGVDQWVSERITLLEKEYREFINGDLFEQLRAYRIDFLVSAAPIPAALIYELPGIRFSTTTSGYFVYAL